MNEPRSRDQRRPTRASLRLSRILVRGWYAVAAIDLAFLLFMIAPPGHPSVLFALGNLLLGAYSLLAFGLLIALNPKGLRRMPRLSLANIVGAIAFAAILAYDSLSHLLPAGSLPHIVDLVPSPVISIWNGGGEFVFMAALVTVIWAYGLHELRRSGHKSNPARHL